MHKLPFLCNTAVDIFICVKEDEYHKPEAKRYILNFKGQTRYYSERATVNCITICNSLLQFIFKCFSGVRNELPLNHRKETLKYLSP